MLIRRSRYSDFGWNSIVDPRESEIDIIQAVGRAIRKSKNKTKGTIILPVFIGRDENSEYEINKSDFKKIWKVINALKAHDYQLGEVLSGLRNELGRKGKNIFPNLFQSLFLIYRKM